MLVGWLLKAQVVVMRVAQCSSGREVVGSKLKE